MPYETHMNKIENLFLVLTNVYLFQVEIFWPCEWLKGQITIVDSPGVGEDDELTELVKQYVPKASAFIYVINTPNAGGIQPDRVKVLFNFKFWIYPVFCSCV